MTWTREDPPDGHTGWRSTEETYRAWAAGAARRDALAASRARPISLALAPNAAEPAGFGWKSLFFRRGHTAARGTRHQVRYRTSSSGLGRAFGLALRGLAVVSFVFGAYDGLRNRTKVEDSFGKIYDLTNMIAERAGDAVTGASNDASLWQYGADRAIVATGYAVGIYAGVAGEAGNISATLVVAGAGAFLDLFQ